MAIALDDSSIATPAAASSLTWSHTVSGADRVLSVQVTARDGAGTNNEATGVTYNGDAMTRVREDTSNFNTYRSSIWRLIAPDTGTHDVVVTFAGSVGIVAEAAGVSLTGVDQTTPVCGQGGNGANSTFTAIGATVTTTEDNAWIIDVIKKGGDDVPDADGSQVSLETSESAGHFAVSRLGPISPAGATAVGYTWTNTANAVYSAVAYAPAAGGFEPAWARNANQVIQ
jgi:hypothetical protein